MPPAESEKDALMDGQMDGRRDGRTVGLTDTQTQFFEWRV